MNAEEITLLLDGLAERLTPAAQQTFDILVHRILVEYISISILSIITLAICAVAGVIIWRVTGKQYLKEEAEYDRLVQSEYSHYISKPDIFGLWFNRIMSFFFLAIPVSFAVLGLATSFISLMTIEYTALMRLLGAI